MLKCAITNFSNISALAVKRRDKEIHKAIKRLDVLMPAGFKHTIGKQIQVGWKTQRHLHGRVFGIGEATDGRAGCS